jgi:hypothetical protein
MVVVPYLNKRQITDYSQQKFWNFQQYAQANAEMLP